jgi:hypothetical protein
VSFTLIAKLALAVTGASLALATWTEVADVLATVLFVVIPVADAAPDAAVVGTPDWLAGTAPIAA